MSRVVVRTDDLVATIRKTMDSEYGGQIRHAGNRHQDGAR
jgi:hypothetical protein